MHVRTIGLCRRGHILNNVGVASPTTAWGPGASGVSSRRVDEFLLRGLLRGQNSHLTTSRHEIKSPLQQYEESISKSDEEVNMHDCPEHPCREASESYKPQVGYCVCPAYDCEITLIPIPERFRFLLTCHPAPNDLRNVLALLDSRLSYARQRHRSFRFDAQ